MFTLITLVDPSPLDEWFNRQVWRTYKGFDRLFRLVDIREYRASENTSEVTLLDRYAMFMLMYFQGVTYESLIERLANTRNLVFMTSDLHYWSIFPGSVEPAFFTQEQLSPADNRHEQLFDMFDRLNIHHLITTCECPELTQIQSERPALKTYVINLHFDPAIFRDYGLQKAYDVIVYGSLSRTVYPFRNRVSRLLIESGRFNVLRLGRKSELYDPEVCGEGLARKINQSWLGLTDITTFDYLVNKYFEIPASRGVVLGNMNEQGRAIYGDKYIHIDEQMSDSEILNVVAEALSDRNRLQEYADQMYQVMHTGHTLAAHERKLFDVTRQIHERCVS